MKIKDLPPKLRALAESRVDTEYYHYKDNGDLEWSFDWEETPEEGYFWHFVDTGNFEEAYKLQPHLREEKYDYINPDHYKNGSKEVWEMMVDIWGVEAFIKHCEMCAFKYRQRLGLKPNQPIERDLEKAKWYEDKVKELSK